MVNMYTRTNNPGRSKIRPSAKGTCHAVLPDIAERSITSIQRFFAISVKSTYAVILQTSDWPQIFARIQSRNAGMDTI